MKAQAIRVADVIAIGPLMIAAGVILAKGADKPRPALGIVLAAIGVATIGYNALNWYQIEKGRPA